MHPQQAVAQKVDDPLGIAHIGLAARNGLDMLRVDHEHRKAVFQQVVDGLPMPGDAVLALRTRHDLVVPVDVELRDSEGAGGMRLPTRVDVHRPNEPNGMRVA